MLKEWELTFIIEFHWVFIACLHFTMYTIKEKMQVTTSFYG